MMIPRELIYRGQGEATANDAEPDTYMYVCFNKSTPAVTRHVQSLIRPRALRLLTPQLHNQDNERIRRDAKERRDTSLRVAKVSEPNRT